MGEVSPSSATGGKPYVVAGTCNRSVRLVLGMQTTPPSPPPQRRSSGSAGYFPHCTVCHAPVSSRAAACAVCDAPLPPLSTTVPSGESSGEYIRFHKPPEELRALYNDLARALAPNIRLLGMVGEGGMAIVFLGRDSVLKRQVAIKLLSPTLADEAVARKRFTREAEAVARVTHPNIVNVYQVGELADRAIPYFVMQFVDGPTLGMGALRGKMLTEVRVRRLMADVAAGLAAANRRKVVHRDIKPSNIILDGETGRAMVLDFGISAAISTRRQSLGSRLTDEGMYIGTPTYMSPEQGNGEEVTGKSDVYSLGIVAFELLMGRPPFEGSPVSVMASHMREVPPRVDDLRSDLSDELSTLIARCLEKNPARRPSAEDIVHFLQPGAKQAVEWPPPGLARVRSAGGRLLGALSMMVVGVALFFAVMAIWPELAIVRRAGSEPNHVRSFILGACLAILFALAVRVIFHSVLGAQRWRWALKSGYPSWVIADVFCDGQRDAGNLINGAGDFVFVSGTTRRLLLMLRRLQFGVVVFGTIIGFIGVGRWLAAWLEGSGSISALDVAMRWALPLLVAFVVYFGLGIPEWRVRRRERGRVTGVPARQNVPPVQGELVTMWLASAEKARKSLAGEPVPRRSSGATTDRDPTSRPE
jgi:tRNA A-37 threonylcarbamoyl transferase component Bud32